MKNFLWRLSRKFFLFITIWIISPMHSFAFLDKEEDRYIPVYLGADRRTPIGSHVCQQSILDHSTLPISVTFLHLPTLKKAFPSQRVGLTDFTYSRFIVPYLNHFKGWSLFMDGNDMLVRDDIVNLWKLRDPKYTVMVIKHPNFEETHKTHSFMNKTISTYPMLNWSSVILFNNEKCKKLTPEYLDTADYYDLHQFKWLENEELIGSLPKTWNHLVGYYEPRKDASLVHWTLGAPYQGGEFEKSEHAEEWFLYRDKLSLPSK